MVGGEFAKNMVKYVGVQPRGLCVVVSVNSPPWGLPQRWDVLVVVSAGAARCLFIKAPLALQSWVLVIC